MEHDKGSSGERLPGRVTIGALLLTAVGGLGIEVWLLHDITWYQAVGAVGWGLISGWAWSRAIDRLQDRARILTDRKIREIQEAVAQEKEAADRDPELCERWERGELDPRARQLDGTVWTTTGWGGHPCDGFPYCLPETPCHLGTGHHWEGTSR